MGRTASATEGGDMNIKLIPLELGRGGALDGAAAATERREMKDHIDTLREGMERRGVTH